MKKYFIYITLVAFLFIGVVHAEDSQVSDLQKKIDEYALKILQLSKTKDTLNNQIVSLDSEIKKTGLEITQTETRIKILEKEILGIDHDISILDQDISKLTVIYIEQANRNYRYNKFFTDYMIFNISDVDQLLKSYKYLRTSQLFNQDTVYQMETAKQKLDKEKLNKSDKQNQLEKLNQQLVSQKRSLDVQVSSKKNLLSVTKNDESKYQKMKSEAEMELSSLLTAKFVGKKEVKKGEVIGIMGNTGYSFGAHLHFGLYNLSESDLSKWSYYNDTDPTGYLSSNIWPMSSPVEITQGRGRTKYAYLYSDRFHHGIDMVSPKTSIMTVNDGVAYFYRNPSSSLGNHVKIFHPDGKMTLYLHLQ